MGALVIGLATSQSRGMPAPLEGIRVVEVASYVAAPACGALLADLGAEVIKVEVPWGEIYRHSLPRFAGFDSDFAGSPHFHMDNRGKRSLALDLARRVDFLNGLGRQDTQGGSVRSQLVICIAEVRIASVINLSHIVQLAPDFLLNAGEAIWARGVDVATDKGMRKVTGRTGLFWPDVVAAMQDDAWRPIVDANRESMMDSGCWGVPTMRLGDFVVWGQDRGWLLARHIEELCEAGDGILV